MSVAEICDSARRVWPQFQLGSAFEAFVESRGGTTSSGADLGIVFACLSGEPGAIEAFTRYVRPAVDGALSRSRGADRDDLEQALWLKLFTGNPPGLGQYSGMGSLKGWVRIAISRLAINQATRGRDEAEGDSQLLHQLSPREDPEIAALKNDLKGGFQGALEEAFLSLSSRERQLLRQVISGATVDDVARALTLPRSTAGRHIKDARDHFALALRQEVERQFGAASISARRMLELVESQLDQGWWELTRVDGRRG